MYHMSGMLNQRRLGRLGRHGEDCYTCVQQCDTAAVTEVGGVYTFGDGEEGLLGHGDWENQLVPGLVPAAGLGQCTQKR